MVGKRPHFVPLVLLDIYYFATVFSPAKLNRMARQFFVICHIVDLSKMIRIYPLYLLRLPSDKPSMFPYCLDGRYHGEQ